MKYDHAKELSQEYTTKSFHTSPLDTLKKVITSPAVLIKFLGESKHLRNFILLISAISGMFYWFILIYPIFVVFSYLIFCNNFISKIEKSN